MKLSQIYKANQCMDLNDVNTAIDDTKRRIHSAETDNRSCKSLIKRLNSLLRKRNSLING